MKLRKASEHGLQSKRIITRLPKARFSISRQPMRSRKVHGQRIQFGG